MTTHPKRVVGTIKLMDQQTMTNPSKQNQERYKTCELCHDSVQVAFRIRTIKSKEWIFVCRPCCQKSAAEIGYQYGGTWKGKKK